MLPRSRGEWILFSIVALAAAVALAGFGYLLAVQQRWIAFPRSLLILEYWHPWAFAAIAAAFLVLYSATRKPPG